MSKSVKKSPAKTIKRKNSSNNVTIVKGERMVATNLRTRLEEPLFVTKVCEHKLQNRKTPVYMLKGIGLKTHTDGLSRIVSEQKAIDTARAIGEDIIKCPTKHRPKKVKKEPKEKKEKKEKKVAPKKKKVVKSPVTSPMKSEPKRRVMKVSDSPLKKKKAAPKKKKAVKKTPKK